MPYSPPSGASCFTDWRPNCDIQHEYKNGMKHSSESTKLGHEFRNTLQNTADKIIKSNRKSTSCEVIMQQQK